MDPVYVMIITSIMDINYANNAIILVSRVLEVHQINVYHVRTTLRLLDTLIMGSANAAQVTYKYKNFKYIYLIIF
jgi:hypothetical protein